MSEQALMDIEDTISRYALQCYATEGAYPPNLDYLVENYGLFINEDKYIYEFETVAENIRPSIKVYYNFESRGSND